MKGIKKSPETVEKMKAAQKGKKISEETRLKISLSLKGRNMPWVAEQNRQRVWSEKTKKKRRLIAKRNWKRGAFHALVPTKEHRNKNADAHRGEKAYNWKPDRTFRLIRMQFHSSPEHTEWRNKVFKRDDYTCQECGVRGGYLEPHHIVPISVEWDKRLEIKNGITLCRPCHLRTMGKESNFQERFTLKVAAQGKLYD